MPRPSAWPGPVPITEPPAPCAGGTWGKMTFLEQLSLRQGLEHHMLLTNLLRCPWVSPKVLNLGVPRGAERGCSSLHPAGI